MWKIITVTGKVILLAFAVKIVLLVLEFINFTPVVNWGEKTVTLSHHELFFVVCGFIFHLFAVRAYIEMELQSRNQSY